jgi:hypothetical protein
MQTGVAPMTRRKVPLAKCVWCGKMRGKFSEWEQLHRAPDGYELLCIPCADERLRNPWNALLHMRKRGGS